METEGRLLSRCWGAGPSFVPAVSLCGGGGLFVLAGAWNLVPGRRLVSPGCSVWAAVEIHMGASAPQWKDHSVKPNDGIRDKGAPEYSGPWDPTSSSGPALIHQYCTLALWQADCQQLYFFLNFYLHWTIAD